MENFITSQNILMFFVLFVNYNYNYLCRQQNIYKLLMFLVLLPSFKEGLALKSQSRWGKSDFYSLTHPKYAYSPISRQFLTCLHHISSRYVTQNKSIAILDYPSLTYPTYPDIDVIHQEIHDRYQILQTPYGNTKISRLHGMIISIPQLFVVLLPDIANGQKVCFILGKLLEEIQEGVKNTEALIVVVATVQLHPKQRYNLALCLIAVTWEVLKVNNVIVLLPESTVNESFVIDIFGWLIEHQKTPCIASLDTVTLFDRWLSSKGGFEYNNDLFPAKSVFGLQNICVLKILLRKFTPYIYGPYGEQLIGYYSEVLSAFMRNTKVKLTFRWDARENTDILSLLSFGNSYFADECQNIYPYFLVDLIWLVPSGEPIPKWQSLIRIFNYNMWACTILIFILGSLTFWLISKHEDHPKSIVQIITYVFLTHIDQGSGDIYKRHLSILLFSVWLFYCLQINTAYKSALVGFLLNPGEYPPIRSLQELEESGIERAIAVSGSKEPITKYIKCSDEFNCIKRIVTKRHLAILINKDLITPKYLSQYATEDGRVTIVPLYETMYTLYLTFRFNNIGCMFFKRFHSSLVRIIAFGHLHRMHRIIDYTTSKLHYSRVKKEEATIISLSHLQGAFIILFIGLVFAFIVFWGEFMVYYFKNKCKSQVMTL
ncbi:Ionotropic receptor 902 [Blattella germanica]|nr:Ionotropic receptor 902 [Blattella germanica]